ncbi:hypothetical protein QJR26_18100 (plasmid) [Clostridium baratii]
MEDNREELEKFIEALGAKIGDRVIILKEGSGSYTSQWNLEGEHLITDIDYIGYVTFDYGEATIFKPKVTVIEGR